MSTVPLHPDGTPTDPPKPRGLDLTRDKLISLAEAAKLLPSCRHGKNLHPSTLTRWIRHGVKKGQERIRLKGQRIGHGRATTARWLEEFLLAINDAADAADPPTSSPGPVLLPTITQEKNQQRYTQDGLRRHGLL